MLMISRVVASRKFIEKEKYRPLEIDESLIYSRFAILPWQSWSVLIHKGGSYGQVSKSIVDSFV
jgi:hypothetical protein